MIRHTGNIFNTPRYHNWGQWAQDPNSRASHSMDPTSQFWLWNMDPYVDDSGTSWPSGDDFT